MEYLVVLRYLLAFAVLAVLGAPPAALLFHHLPRRGAAFALPTALIPLAIAVFWIGQVTFGVHTVLLGVALVGVGTVAAHRLGARPNWRSVAVTYGVFVAGFSVLVVFRAFRPGITPAGGEQFLHFGLVKALARAPQLPPEDFWFAGEGLRYYYGTQLQVTNFSLLTGTDPRYGFNLGIAAFYGVLVVVAYGLAGAIVANRSRSYHAGGVLGVVFVALGGHTTTAVRLATPHLPERLADAVAPAAFGFVARRFNDGDLGRTVTELSNPLDWEWWFTRYVVPGTIQEVPLYSFVKADLHGHALSPGFVLFAGALGYAYYATPAGDRARRIATLFGGLGAVAGVFGFMNTWALPTAGGVAVLAAGAADAHPASLLPGGTGSRLRPTQTSDSRLSWVLGELRRLVLAGVAGLLVVGIGIVVASPFLIFGQVPTNEGIGLFPPRSPLGPFLVVYGGLLALFAAYVLDRGRYALSGLDWRLLAGGGLALLAGVVVTAVVLEFPVLAVTGPLLVAGWVLVRLDHGGFELVLLVAGVGLILSLELVHARLPLIDPPRWNTALKVAVQGWTLGAAGAGAAATLLLARALDRIRAALTRVGSSDDGGSPNRRAALGPAVVVTVVGLVILASAVFPVMVFAFEIGGEVADGPPDLSLDGRSYLETYYPDQAAAYRWLDSRRGTPTIVEAPGDPYTLTSPAATYTGLPTVVGWDHQAEYRSLEAYERRVSHVDAIYTGEWETAARHLARYDVRYVVVGPNERDRYGTALRSFDRPAFSVAFDNRRVTIYRVDRDALDSVAPSSGDR